MVSQYTGWVPGGEGWGWLVALADSCGVNTTMADFKLPITVVCKNPDNLIGSHENMSWLQHTTGAVLISGFPPSWSIKYLEANQKAIKFWWMNCSHQEQCWSLNEPSGQQLLEDERLGILAQEGNTGVMTFLFSEDYLDIFLRNMSILGINPSALQIFHLTLITIKR